MNKTVLIKLSGESLAGNNEEKRGLDDAYIEEICMRIKKIHDMGVKVGIVCGGGNFMRGGRTSKVITKEVADYIGMLGTVMNGLALYDAFTRIGCPAQVQSGLSVAVPYAANLNAYEAISSLDEGKVLIFGGGTGHPGCSTDTASADRAVDIKANMIIKLTNVDGVYDKDPNKFIGEAVMYDEVTFDEVLEKKLGVMDLEAMETCKNNNIEIIVANINNKNALVDIINDKKVGTKVYKKELHKI